MRYGRDAGRKQLRQLFDYRFRQLLDQYFFATNFFAKILPGKSIFRFFSFLSAVLIKHSSSRHFSAEQNSHKHYFCELLVVAQHRPLGCV